MFVGILIDPNDCEGQYKKLYTRLKHGTCDNMDTVILTEYRDLGEFGFTVTWLSSKHPCLSALDHGIEDLSPAFYTWFVDIGQTRLCEDLKRIHIRCIILDHKHRPMLSLSKRQLLQHIRDVYDAPPDPSSDHVLARKGGPGFKDSMSKIIDLDKTPL